ncbi:MAG: hypothetical protein JW719_05820, partial [Pirellulales bacterium]|nr:hypothetical protein [Pirellulales bacterium]
MVKKHVSASLCLRGENPPRRGAVLLIVLAVLALFALIGVTFVIVSSHQQRAAQTQARVDQYAEAPDELLNEALMQVLRGSNVQTSVLRNHGLLEDLYGMNWILYVYHDNPPLPDQPNAQLVELPALTIPHFPLVGRVVTMLDGPARGQSTRIVGINPTTGNLQLLAFENATAADLGDYLDSNDLHFVINGAPFGGTGFGYDPDAALATPTDPQLTAADPNTFNLPFALLPNPAGFTPSGSYVDPSGPGEANEDYDAPDYQNLLPALQNP